MPDNYIFTEIERRKRECKRKDLINLGVGDATLPLTKTVLSAYVNAALEMGNIKTFKGYPPETGYDFFKLAVQKDFLNLGVNLDLNEIFVNDGAKSDIFNILSLFDDVTVLVHDPEYPAYVDTNVIFGNRVSFLKSNPSNGFLPMPRHIGSGVYGKSALIYICSPDNPSGAVYGAEGLKKWVTYAKNTDSLIIFDSAYADYISGDYPKSIFQIEGAESVAVEIRSLSKSANFTGVRCGFTVVKNDLRIAGVNFNERFKRLKSSASNGVSYASQRAGEAALSAACKVEKAETVNYYLRNARVIKEFFEKKSIYAVGGENSPYVFFKCPNGEKSFDYFNYLLNQVGVVTVPGVGFGSGGEGYIRVSGFSSYENTASALSRLDSII